MAGRRADIRRNATAQIHEEDLLLLALDLDGLTVTDALSAYGSPDNLLLPMGELSRLLDLNLNVSPAEGQIIGVLGQAQQPLTIDLASGTARLNGKGIDLSPEDVAVTSAEIYIRAAAVQRILPITIKPDIEALSLKLHALEKLPIQARLERLALLRDLNPEAGGGNEPSLRIPTPYKLISPPAFDISGQIGASVTAPRFPHSYDVRIAGDVLYTGFQGYVGSDQNGEISSVRATFERHDAKGDLLGPIHATSASIGDVFTPALPIGPHSANGRGFEFSTAPLEETSVFNRIDLRGELPVGYDVELYINDVLRSGQRTPTQGRYEFLNVPLVRGVNIIRIVLNGPRGERTEETRIINVGGGQVAKGKLNFSMGVLQQDTQLINAGKQNVTDPLGASDLVAPGVGALRVTAALAYGLTNTVTLVGGAAVFPAPPPGTSATGTTTPNAITPTTERELITAGLRTSILGASVQVDAAADSARSEALAFGLAGQPFGVSTLVKQVFYNGGFIDETVAVTSAEKPIVSHTEINTDFNVRAMKNTLIPLTLHGTLDFYADHSTQATAGFRTSSTLGKVLLSGGFDLQSNTMPGAPAINSTIGNLAASTFYDFKWQLRADLDYQITPHFSVTDLNITADRDISTNNSLRLGLGEGFGATPGTTLQLADIMHTHLGDLSITGNYTVPQNQWQLGLNFATGLVFDPYAKRYVLTRPGPASGASLAFQAFQDVNGDGVFDEGDKPVAGVTINGGEHPATTDAHGRVFVPNVGGGASGRIQVGLDAIDDPYVQSPPKTITFAPRAGLVIKAPYPLTSASEVIVRIQLLRDGKKMGLSAVRFRLVPDKGRPIDGSTEFDGSAGFDTLSPGTYHLELDPEQAARLHMHLVAPVVITAAKAGGQLPDAVAEVVFDTPAAPADTPAKQEPAK